MIDIATIKKWIEESDAILIGAGAGLSSAAGVEYSGKKFEKEFKEFIKKYHIKDLYTSSFYPFETEEEKWAYWAKHIHSAYYESPKKELYKKLYQLVKDKNYFVITTNTDGKFIQNGFDKEKVFEVQGSYSKIQCSIPCHKKLYDDEELVKNLLKNIDKDLKVPTSMVPKCPVCGENMNVNLRCDDTFVEDEIWHKMNNLYNTFLDKYENKKVLLLEFGVGYNTPGIIRFPFEEMVYHNSKYHLVRFNNRYAEVPEEIEERSISVTEDINKVLNQIN